MEKAALIKALSTHLYHPVKLNRQAEQQVEKSTLYAVIDAARIDSTWLKLQTDNPQYASLYEGEEAIELEDVCPYLVKLEKNTDFTNWVFEKAYGDYGGIFIHSHADFNTLATHLRNWAKIDFPVEKPSGEVQIQKVFYAFYDPRVFPTFMKASTLEEIRHFFTLIIQVSCEQEDTPETIQTYYPTDDGEEWGRNSHDLTSNEDKDKETA